MIPGAESRTGLRASRTTPRMTFAPLAPWRPFRSGALPYRDPARDDPQPGSANTLPRVRPVLEFARWKRMTTTAFATGQPLLVVPAFLVTSRSMGADLLLPVRITNSAEHI